MRTLPCVVVLLCLAAGGCTKTVYIPTRELVHLDGYDIHNERSVDMVVGYSTNRYGTTPIVGNVPITDRPYRMLTMEGQPVDFNSRTPLVLRMTDGGLTGGHFEHIDVRDGAFAGRTLGDQQDFRVPLTAIRQGEMEVYSRGRTLGVLLGIAGGVLLLTTAVTVGVVVSLHHN